MRGKLDYQYTSAKRSLKAVTDEAERRLIIKVLDDCGYDKLRAAQVMEIDVSGLYKKLKKYGITG
jgi:DNA-binding NtrC family response regulator